MKSSEVAEIIILDDDHASPTRPSSNLWAGKTTKAEKVQPNGLMQPPSSPSPQLKADDTQDKSLSSSNKQTPSLLAVPSLAVNLPPTLRFVPAVVICRPKFFLSGENVEKEKQALNSLIFDLTSQTSRKIQDWLFAKGLLRKLQYCLTHSARFNNETGSTQRILHEMKRELKHNPDNGYVWRVNCCPSDEVSVHRGSILEASADSRAAVHLLVGWCTFWHLDRSVPQTVKLNTSHLLRLFCSYALRFRPGCKIGDSAVVDVTVATFPSLTGSRIELVALADRTRRDMRFFIHGEDRKEVDPMALVNRVARYIHRTVHPKAVLLLDSSLHPSRLLRKVVPPSRVIATENPDVRTPLQDYVQGYLTHFIQKNSQYVRSWSDWQGILDELAWRETHGRSPQSAFDSLLAQLSQETTRFEDPASIEMELGLLGVLKDVARRSPNNALNICDIRPLGYGYKFQENSIVSRSRPPLLIPEKRKLPKESQSVKKVKFNSDSGIISPTSTVSSKFIPSSKSQKTSPRKAFPDAHSLQPVSHYYYVFRRGEEEMRSISPSVVLDYSCSYCNREFQDAISISEHLLLHVMDGGFCKDLVEACQCRSCLRILPSPFDLQTHIETHHIQHRSAFSRLYRCAICLEGYLLKQDFIGHMSKMHVPREMPYACNLCSFRTASYTDFFTHSRTTHAKGGRFLCKFCLKTFSMSCNSAMSRFLCHLSQHTEAGEAQSKLKCRKCCLSFTNNAQLKTHIKRDHVSHPVKGECAPVPPNPEDMGANLLVLMGTERNALVPTVYKTDLQVFLSTDLRGLICNDCRLPFARCAHFEAIHRCTHCIFESACPVASRKHLTTCVGISKRASSTSSEVPHHSHAQESGGTYFCVCGYSSEDGCKLASHLTGGCGSKVLYNNKSKASQPRIAHASFPRVLDSSDEDLSEKKASRCWELAFLKHAATLESGKKCEKKVSTVDGLQNENYCVLEAVGLRPKKETKQEVLEEPVDGTVEEIIGTEEPITGSDVV